MAEGTLWQIHYVPNGHDCRGGRGLQAHRGGSVTLWVQVVVFRVRLGVHRCRRSTSLADVSTSTKIDK